MMQPAFVRNGLSEREVTQQHKDFLRLRGWRMIRFQATIVPGKFQTTERGMPDFLAVRYVREAPKGRALLFWLELKRPKGGRLAPAQIEWRRKEELAGGLVVVSSDLEAFEKWYSAWFGWLHDGSVEGQVHLQF